MAPKLRKVVFAALNFPFFAPGEWRSHCHRQQLCCRGVGGSFVSQVCCSVVPRKPCWVHAVLLQLCMSLHNSGWIADARVRASCVSCGYTPSQVYSMADVLDNLVRLLVAMSGLAMVPSAGFSKIWARHLSIEFPFFHEPRGSAWTFSSCTTCMLTRLCEG